MEGVGIPVDNQDVAILGSEYCSGYIDSLGKWNTGFYCPDSEQSGTVFCCGSDTHKYCCTTREQRVQEEVDGLTVMIGVLVGASTALLLLTIVSCMYCPWCPHYSRKEKLKGSRNSLNTTTRQEKMSYSIVCNNEEKIKNSQPIAIAKPKISNSQTLPHGLSHCHGKISGCRSSGVLLDAERAYKTLGHLPRNQRESFPPSYHLLPRGSYLLIPQERETFDPQMKNVDDEEEDGFLSTKF